MIGKHIAAPCTRCDHSLGDHNTALGACARCDQDGGPCSYVQVVGRLGG